MMTLIDVKRLSKTTRKALLSTAKDNEQWVGRFLRSPGAKIDSAVWIERLNYSGLMTEVIERELMALMLSGK